MFPTKIDQQITPALSLPNRKRHDTTNVVIFRTPLLFAEVADKVAAVFVARAHAIEEERVDVVVECFVVEEEFGEEAEIPAPGALAAAIDVPLTVEPSLPSEPISIKFKNAATAEVLNSMCNMLKCAWDFDPNRGLRITQKR